MNVYRLLLGIVVFFTVTPVVQAATNQSGSGAFGGLLPSGARVERTSNVVGYMGTTAVSYEVKNASTVALLQKMGGKYAIRWSRALGSGSWTVTSPGPKGLLQGESVRTASGSQKGFAYLFDGRRVSSAIQGKPSGEIAGNRGVAMKPSRIVVRQRDAKHVGNVRYRFDTPYAWSGKLYVPGVSIHRPDYPKGGEPQPSATLHASDGSSALIQLRIADTPATRESGLMYVKSMDPDAGMIFVWQTPVLEAFWMQNTLIPLSIAWIDSSMKIIDIQDMAPLDESLHSPPAPYLYAIEANQGYFANNGIHVGDTVQLHLNS